MTNQPRPDWRGLTERIRVWQGATFPAVTEQVGKWRAINEVAELGKKVARSAPDAEIREEAADVIITMQHMERIEEFFDARRRFRMPRSWLRSIAQALIWNHPDQAFPWLLEFFPDEHAAYAEVERKFAKNLKRKWDIRPDGSGQHQELSPAEVTLEKVRTAATLPEQVKSQVSGAYVRAMGDILAILDEGAAE